MMITQYRCRCSACIEKKNFGDDLYVITDIILCALHYARTLRNSWSWLCSEWSLPWIFWLAWHWKLRGSGADMVAPSDMMDGRVLAIGINWMNIILKIQLWCLMLRNSHLHIMALSGKQRIRLPETATVKSYQMDFHPCARSCSVRAKIDETEGADIFRMVKAGIGIPWYHSRGAKEHNSACSLVITFQRNIQWWKQLQNGLIDEQLAKRYGKLCMPSW